MTSYYVTGRWVRNNIFLHHCVGFFSCVVFIHYLAVALSGSDDVVFHISNWFFLFLGDWIKVNFLRVMHILQCILLEDTRHLAVKDIVQLDGAITYCLK